MRLKLKKYWNHNPWCECAQCQPRGSEIALSESPCRAVEKDGHFQNSHSRGTDNAELTAGYVLKQIYHLTKTVKKANRDYMPSASAAAAAKKGEHGNLLKGKCVPKKMWNGFDIKITEVREAPKDWTGLFVIDFEEVKGVVDENGAAITAFPLNKTNTAIIAAKYGDDTDRWAKKTVRLVVYMGRDVGSGKPTPCIAVSE